MVAAKKERNRVQGVGYGVGFSSRRGGRMRPLTSEQNTMEAPLRLDV